MRLSHKRKIAHKKGVYHPRLTYSLLRVSSAKWQSRLAKQLKQSKGPIMIEVNSPGGEVGTMSKFANAAKQWAEAAILHLRTLPLFSGVMRHGNT